MIADSHVHTRFSVDSEAEISDYLRIAEEKEIDHICFTDHVDFNELDYGVNYYSTQDFFRHYDSIKNNYTGKVQLHAGIEFSEPHLYPMQLQNLLKQPYDFVIGSIHWIGAMFPCQEVREKYSAKEFFTLYWQEVLRSVKVGGFDCLGHIDFPKRYYKEVYYEEEMLNEIFKVLLDRQIILEINTSSLRKGMKETMPSLELLQIYKDNGGEFVTIGSDAHTVEDLAADNQIAKKMICESSLKEVVFLERKMRLI